MPGNNPPPTVTRQRLVLLFKQAQTASSVGMAGALCTSLFFARETPTAWLWLLLVSLATGARFLVYKRFAGLADQYSNGYWLRWHGITAVLVGVAWGLVPAVVDYTRESYLHELGMLIPGFIIMAAIPSYGVFFSQYSLFLAATSITANTVRLISEGPVAIPEVLLYLFFLPTPLLTARRVSESLIRSLESEQVLATEVTRRRLHFTQSRDGVIILNRDGGVEEASPSFARMLGRTLEETSHLHVWDWDPDWPETRWHRDIRTNPEAMLPGIFETRWCRSDQHIFPVEISHNPVIIDGQQYFYCVCRDVSERSTAEGQLREKEALLQAMSAMAQIGGWQFDVATGENAWTEQTARILDAPSGLTVTATTRMDLYVGGSRARLTDAMRTAISQCQAFDLELELLTDTGKHKWVRILGSPVVEQDAVVKVRGALQDITLQKQLALSQREHHALETRLAKISESVPGLICAFRMSGNGQLSMPIASPAIDAVFGLPPETLLHTLDPIWDNMPAEQIGELRESLRFSGRNLSPWRTDFLYRHPSQGERWYEARAVPQREADNSILWYACIMDITERKNIEKARQRAVEDLRDSEERYRLVVDLALDAVMSMESNGRIVAWNSQAERIFGWSRAEAMGRSLSEMIVAPNSRQKSTQGLATYLAAEDGPVLNQHIEVTGRRRDGTEFPLELAITPIETRDQCLFTAFLRDITDRKAAEAELRQHRDHLQDLVDERTHDLCLAKEAAEEANRAKSQFLANMSHELRTPMHAILGFAQRGSNPGKTHSPEKLQRYFRNIAASGTRLMHLLNDLLDLSKLEAGCQQWCIAVHDLADIVEAIMAELDVLIEENRLRTKVTAYTDNCTLECDGARIGQVLRNILGNAIKFSPAGSRISIELADAVLPSPEEIAEGAVPALLVRVLDEGPGIPEAELDTVFDKFYQSTKTRTGAGGTGLGLTISREIVSAHGGIIHANNNPDIGANVSLILPRRPDALLNIEESSNGIISTAGSR